MVTTKASLDSPMTETCAFHKLIIGFKDLPESNAVNGVKCLSEVNKDHIQWLMLLCCLPLELVQSEDQVRSGTASPESTLTLWENVFQNELQSVQDDLGEDFASYGQ